MTTGLLRPQGSFFWTRLALCGLLGKPGGNPPSSCSSRGGGLQETHRISQALRQPRPAPLGLGEDGSSGDTLPFPGACLGWEHKCLEGNTMSSELLPHPPPPGSVFYCEAPSSSHLLPDPDVGDGGDNSRGVCGVGVDGEVG